MALVVKPPGALPNRSRPNGRALFSLAISYGAALAPIAVHVGVGVQKDARLLVRPAGEDQELGIKRPAIGECRRGPRRVAVRRRAGQRLGEPVEEILERLDAAAGIERPAR